MEFRVLRLKHLITAEYGCRADHAGTRIVVERAPDGTLWRGPVEAFDLVGHPLADRCYAWFGDAEKEAKPATMLKIAPVTSAQTALRVALARPKLAILPDARDRDPLRREGE